jgi:hypothetical protein
MLAQGLVSQTSDLTLGDFVSTSEENALDLIDFVTVPPQ